MNNSDTSIYINGRIFTADDENPHADSMIVSDGRIRWVGKQEELPETQGTVVDLNGRRVIPGFVDAHMHPVMLADFSKQITIMPPAVNSIEDLVLAIRERRESQGPDRWVEGWGYDEQSLLEKRSPNRHDLDRGCSDAPVCLMRTCAHIRCVNSRALEMAGIDRNTPDPPGGEIERDENGDPTGVLKENARNLMSGLIPAVPEEQKVQNLLDLGKLLTSQGITAICDMGNLDPSDNIPIYEKAAEKGFHQRVGVYYMWDFFADDQTFDIPKERLDKDRQIFAAGLKLIGDGSISGRTAWMDEPYYGSDNEYGISTCSDELMESAIAFCRSHHCQLSMHAMGSRAIARMVDRAAREKNWMEDGTPYVRIEHVTEPKEESLERAADSGIAFITQPIFPYAESASYLKNLGAERLKKCYPFRHVLEKGVKTGFSTDAPATFWAVPSDPFPGLKLAVTRKSYLGADCGADQAIDIETALKLYTRESAQIAGFHDMGMLAPGYRADFAVLNEDILKTNPEDIDKICVVQTYIDGELVYQKED